MGFPSILVLETNAESPELENLSSRFSQLRSIVFQEALSVGEQINVGIRESHGPYVFALWNDMRLSSSALSSRFFDKVRELDAACLVPNYTSADGQAVPSAMNPAAAGQALRVVPLPPAKDGEKSLFPFDHAAIYSKERFVLSGGYDWTITNPYWQLMDFGMRLWLWGEQIVHSRALKMAYIDAPPPMDTTPDRSYARFWLKNLAPRYEDDHAELPGCRFLPFLFNSRLGPVSSVEEFNAAKRWIRTNAYRFRSDAKRCIDLWDPMS